MMTQLIATYHQSLYRYLCRLLRNTEDAKDVLQNTWIQVYTHLGELRNQSSERAYIYRVATRCAYMWLRDEKTMESIEEVDESVLSAIPASAELPQAELILDRLEQVVLRLPPAQRAVFHLRYHEDLSYDEIADITETTISTAKVNYSLAKRKIIGWISSIAACFLLLFSLGIDWRQETNASGELVYSSEYWSDFAEDDLFLE